MRLLASGIGGDALVVALLLASGGMQPALHAQGRLIQEAVQMEPGAGGYLGIEMEDVTAQNMDTYKLSSERGVIIRSVEKGSPAENARLQENDVVLEFGGFPVWSTIQLGRLVRDTPPGRTVDVVVSRQGKKINLTIRMGKREGALSFDNSSPSSRNQPDRQGFGFFGPGGRFFQYQIPDGRLLGPGQPDLWSNIPSQRARLGVTLQPLTAQLAEFFGVPSGKGVLVASTIAGSPAAGKLKAGDVIILADNKSVNSPEELTRIVQAKNDGALDLKVIREKKEIQIAIDLPRGSGTSGGGFRM